MSNGSSEEGGGREVRRVSHPQRSPGTRLLKRIAQGLFLPLALPRLLAYRIGRALWGERRAFSWASEGLARVPGARGVYLRQAFYRRTLEACGRDVYFGWGSVLSTAAARVGEGVYIGRLCSLGMVDLGAETMLGDGAQVLSGARQHGLEGAAEGSLRERPQEYRRVTVGRGCWIGAGAVVMADVGAGAVIGAGAVVSRPVAARAVAAGVPARPLRELDAGS